jgi:hypothetical protein
MRATASAGLALHLAGRRLGEAKYADAAFQAARMVAAVQANTGQVPATGVIRAGAGGRDEPAVVPARGPTCAGLALLLVVLHDLPADGAPGGAGALKPAAVKAAHWLTTQQTRKGAWPSAFLPPAPADGPGASRGARDAKRDAQVRLIRLDDAGSRDATCVLWLAARELDDARLRKRAEDAVEQLLVMRVADERSPGRDLWLGEYNLDGTPLAPAQAEEWGLPVRIDTAASRQAIQALLAASLMGDADATAPALREACAALRRLPHPDGKWERRFELHPRTTQPAPEAEPAPAPAPAPVPAPARAEDEPPPSQVFEPDAREEPRIDAAPGVAEVLAAAERSAELGADQYRQTLGAEMPLAHRVAMTVCGLDDDALTREVRAPRTGPADLRDGPPLTDVIDRARRLAVLLRHVPSHDVPAAPSNSTSGTSR